MGLRDEETQLEMPAERPEDLARDNWTSTQMDNAFMDSCYAKEMTLLKAMEYLRKPNQRQFRKDRVKLSLPLELRAQCEAQCKLEGLL